MAPGAIAVLFGGLALLAFGGGNTVLPALQHALARHHAMDAATFATLYGLAQASPGPNQIVVTLLGWHLAGATGALAATLATFLPPALVTVAVIRLWTRAGEARWRHWLRAGLPPVTAGLVSASAGVICAGVVAAGTARAPVLAAIAAGAAALAMGRRLHPLWLLAGGAAMGALLG